MSAIAHGALLLVLGLGDIAWGARMFALSRQGVRTGQPSHDVRNAAPTMLVGALLDVGLLLALSTDWGP